jgi:mitochondrial import receptor subunit TOM40
MFSLRGQCGLGLKGLIGKAQFQFAPQAPGALQVEFDQTGKSYSSNVKAVNPSPDGTGIFVLSHLQSVSKKLALGLEYVFKKETPQDKMDGQGSFIAKYVGSNFVLTGNLSQIGILQASYFHKVNEKVKCYSISVFNALNRLNLVQSCS